MVSYEYHCSACIIPVSGPFTLENFTRLGYSDAQHRNPPLEKAAYEPDIPAVVPSSRIYTDGDGGLSNADRLREHWNPSPVWDHLTANSPPVSVLFTLDHCLLASITFT